MLNKVIYHKNEKSHKGFKMRKAFDEIFSADKTLSGLKESLLQEFKKIKLDNKKSLDTYYRIEVNQEFTPNNNLFIYNCSGSLDVLVIQVYQS